MVSLYIGLLSHCPVIKETAKYFPGNSADSNQQTFKTPNDGLDSEPINNVQHNSGVRNRELLFFSTKLNVFEADHRFAIHRLGRKLFRAFSGRRRRRRRRDDK